MDARSFFCHDDTSKISIIQGGSKSEPGNMAQRWGFSWGRSQNRSRSTKTGARTVASNGPKSEEISAKPLPRPALRGGVNSGGDTALSRTFFAPSVHPLILASGRSWCLRHTAPTPRFVVRECLYPAHTAIYATAVHRRSHAGLGCYRPLTRHRYLQLSAVGRSPWVCEKNSPLSEEFRELH
ncbi:hypothetical protein HMPREF1545_00339 [Oscillibacter sp. KLE 1728]|nr:hypothetical protein HMPREF1545_00339 [Oscillibacter sp. KLE 1728]ERK67128.1 hypothetical protein HMPREF1546_00635 [Oscillibacter sp. KLE 1745]